MTHLLHSCTLALVFYLLYKIIIKGSQGFQAHRWYLLAIPVVSAVLPLFVIPLGNLLNLETVLVAEGVNDIPLILTSSNAPTAPAAQPAIDAVTMIWILYAAGAGCALLLFMYKLARIYQWKDDGSTKYVDGSYIVTVHKLPTAFSFLNYIFINDAIEKAEYDQILLHEMTHVKEKHSWDLLFYEFLRILFWFHPVSYLAQRDLKLIHEHIADERTIAVHGRKSYYENLLKQVMDCPDFSFANAFFKLKTIKTRLAMINNTQPKKFPARKLIWMLPILFASLTYTACSTELETVNTKDVKAVEDLPTLQGFVYGTKDYYKGVTQEERAVLDAYRSKMDAYFNMDPRPSYKEMLKTVDFTRYYEIQRKIRENGSTVVVDTDNGMILTITESPSGTVHYTGNSFDEQLSMSFDEYNAYVTKLKNATADQKEVTEEIVGVEAIPKETATSEKTATVPFAIIDEVPTYPGCSGTNEERKNCMQENLTKHVLDNFDTNIAKKVGLSGKQTILVQFLIDLNGNAVKVVSRAKAPELQAEAARVINSIPTMQPGIQRGQPVQVIYAMPIIFEVN